MTLIAFEPRRGAVVSKARALAIVEEVAEKHGHTVDRMLCAAWKRDMVLARSEAAYRLHNELNLSFRAIGERLGCTGMWAGKLFRLHKKRADEVRRLMPRTDLHALVNVEACEAKRQAFEAKERASFLEAELQRLTGVHVALRLSETLGIRLRCAIVLGIVIEAYPRAVMGGEILELYDEACVNLSYGAQRGADYNLIAANCKDLRAHFAAQGWPLPLGNNNAAAGHPATARRLTDDAAQFLQTCFGAPRLSQIEAASEARSLRVRASMRG